MGNLRWVFGIGVAAYILIQGSFLIPEPASAQGVKRKIKSSSLLELPFFTLNRSLPFPNTSPSTSSERTVELLAQPPTSKIRFVPANILSNPFDPVNIPKESPRITPAFNRRKRLPDEPIKKPHTGIVVEGDAAYGNYQTFIGRFQHGIQFKGAHYAMQGHWEKTDGKGGDQHEEHLSGHLNLNVDLSKQTSASLNSSYFHSDIVLPPVYDAARHKKSAIELIAGLHVHPGTDTEAALEFSGEYAAFSDQNHILYEMNSYGSQINFKHFWTPQNSLNFSVNGQFEEYFQESERLDRHYYGTAILLNTLTVFEDFAFDTGVRFDYDYSEERMTRSLISPVAAARIRLFEHTNVYATYSPRLQAPNLTDLYIKTPYITISPDLRPEKMVYDVESGIQQQFGNLFTLTAAGFYRKNENMILRTDENLDQLLEYVQADSVRSAGLKANLQMNYRERFVQNITYTYTKYAHIAWKDGDFGDGTVRADILPYQPQHQVQASLSWIAPFGLSIDVSGIYISEQYRNRHPDRNRFGDRFFLNAELTQKFSEHVQVYLIGRNLTDTNIADILTILDSEEITSSRLIIGGVRIRF